jgi:NADPH-dependent curcumin reductase CurA
MTVAFGANKVFTTAGTADKVAFLDKLSGGKVHPINYREQSKFGGRFGRKDC